MGIKKKTKQIVGSAVLLGAGNVALSGVGAPGISGAMLTPLTHTAFGLETVNMLGKAGKKHKKKY